MNSILLCLKSLNGFKAFYALETFLEFIYHLGFLEASNNPENFIYHAHLHRTYFSIVFLDDEYDPTPGRDKSMCLVDSGIAFNSPYPMLLRPERNVEIILSFDFSQRDGGDTEPPFSVSTLPYDDTLLLVKHSLILSKMDIRFELCTLYKTRRGSAVQCCPAEVNMAERTF